MATEPSGSLEPRPQREINPAVGGASVGTVVAGLATVFGEGTFLGQLLLVLAPGISAVGGYAIFRVQSMIRRRDQRAAEQRAAADATDRTSLALGAIERTLQDPSISDDYRSELLAVLDDLRREEVQILIEGARQSRRVQADVQRRGALPE